MCKSFSIGKKSNFNFQNLGYFEKKKSKSLFPAEALAKAEKQRATTEETDRSEFEIDFKLTVQPKTIDSAFQSDPSPNTESFIRTTSFQVKAFDFGSSDSVFGE